MTTKKIGVFIASLLFSASSLATSKWSGDWFEIEVILLSQLHDKSLLSEAFPDKVPLPNANKTLDLLSAYLTPDISSLKQKLPHCSDPVYPKSLLEQSTKIPSFHDILTLEEVFSLPSEPILDTNTPLLLLNENLTQLESTEQNAEQLQQAAIEQTLDETTQAQQEQLEGINSTKENQLPKLVINDNLTEQGELAQTDEGDNQLTMQSPPLTEEEIALIEEAEQAFGESPFIYQSLYQNESHDSPSPICHMTKEEYQLLNVNTKLYAYDRFATLSMPRKINNPEDLYSEKPYLLSKESFKLSDIFTQLTRSKNFRPLLHVAWRQPVFEQPKSTPIKLFSGDNLEHHYQQQLAIYNAEVLAADQQEALLEQALLDASESLNNTANRPLDNDEADLATSTPQQLLTLAKTEHISSILTNINQVTDAEQVIKEVVSNANNQSAFEQLMIANELTLGEPKVPIQPWYLYGLLNVYLKGVYLNIAADFNILNHTLAEQESLKLKPNSQHQLKAINFKQSRRVISKEVHYFDHPYMGMVVQIRRHKRPKPPQEDISHEQGVSTN